MNKHVALKFTTSKHGTPWNGTTYNHCYHWNTKELKEISKLNLVFLGYPQLKLCFEQNNLQTDWWCFFVLFCLFSNLNSS